MSEQPPSGNRWEPHGSSGDAGADAGPHEVADGAPAPQAPTADERSSSRRRSGKEKGLLAGVAAVLLAAGLGGGWAIGSASGADAEGPGHHGTGPVGTGAGGTGPGGLPGSGEWQPPSGTDGDHHGSGHDDGPGEDQGAGSQTDAS